MKKVPVSSIGNTMIVGRDICGSNGNILVTKGTVLSSAMGRRLESWGVTNIYVEGEEDEPQETNTQTESPEELKQALLDKFSLVMDNPLMKKIFNAVFEFRQSKP